MQTKIVERYFFFSLLLGTLAFTFLIFKPFLPLLIISASFAVVLFPIYKYLQSKKIPDALSALVTVFLFIVLICGPVLGIGILVFNQSKDVYENIAASGGPDLYFHNIENLINQYVPTDFNFNINDKIGELATFVSRNVAKIFTSTLTTLFSFFLIIISLFFFLKDGKGWRKALVMLSPLRNEDDEKILNKLSLSINGIIKGYLLIAIIQGVLMGAGMAFFGVPNSALWGVIAAIGSLIPTVGTALVSVPATIFLFATGNTPGGIGMAIWAFMIVGWVDNLLNPIIISSKINIPQIMVLFSVLGGLVLLGPIGFLMGPLTVSLLYALISIYNHEFKPTAEEK
jgi:predicted PurR-regulated permease PerM